MFLSTWIDGLSSGSESSIVSSTELSLRSFCCTGLVGQTKELPKPAIAKSNNKDATVFIIIVVNCKLVKHVTFERIIKQYIFLFHDAKFIVSLVGSSNPLGFLVYILPIVSSC